MTGIVVSDASPLHYLILAGAVDYLPRLFECVIIPAGRGCGVDSSEHPSARFTLGEPASYVA